MPSEHEKETMAKRLVKRDELIALWEKIKAGRTPQWERGDAFEYLIVRAFKWKN